MKSVSNFYFFHFFISEHDIKRCHMSSFRYSSVIKVFDDSVMKSLETTRALIKITKCDDQHTVDSFIKQTKKTSAKLSPESKIKQFLKKVLKN